MIDGEQAAERFRQAGQRSRYAGRRAETDREPPVSSIQEIACAQVILERRSALGKEPEFETTAVGVGAILYDIDGPGLYGHGQGTRRTGGQGELYPNEIRHLSCTLAAPGKQQIRECLAAFNAQPGAGKIDHRPSHLAVLRNQNGIQPAVRPGRMTRFTVLVCIACSVPENSHLPSPWRPARACTASLIAIDRAHCRLSATGTAVWRYVHLPVKTRCCGGNTGQIHPAALDEGRPAASHRGQSQAEPPAGAIDGRCMVVAPAGLPARARLVTLS